MTPAPRRCSWAGAYQNNDFLLIDTYSGYRGSAYDPKGEHLILSKDSSDDVLGNAVLKCLEASRFLEPEDVPAFFDYKVIAQEYEEWVQSMVNRFGYKNKRGLFRKMKHCFIECYEQRITIRPTIHESLEGWSMSKEIEDILVDKDGPVGDIGGALKFAFSKCR